MMFFAALLAPGLRQSLPGLGGALARGLHLRAEQLQLLGDPSELKRGSRGVLGLMKGVRADLKREPRGLRVDEGF